MEEKRVVVPKAGANIVFYIKAMRNGGKAKVFAALLAVSLGCFPPIAHAKGVMISATWIEFLTTPSLSPLSAMIMAVAAMACGIALYIAGVVAWLLRSKD